MLFSNIEVKGHSGCSIEVVEQGRKLILHKGTHDRNYICRLKRQAEKQKRFFSSGYGNINTPKIIGLEETKDSCIIKMEYVHAQNFVEFFDHAGFEKIERFTKQVVQFIDWEVTQSEMRELPPSIVLEKVADVNKKIQHKFFMDADIVLIMKKSEMIFSKISKIQIPVGQCHGDFTLSNVLFNHDRIFVIDFLDSFIESPLMDMIKIRQDTAFGWSYLMYGNTFDKVRHQITIEWIDRVLTDHFSNYEWYKQYYGVFQLINFLRILQYAHQPEVINYLIEKINILLYTHEF